MTREELLAARDERAKAAIAARPSTLRLSRVAAGIRVEMYAGSPALRALAKARGYSLVPDHINTYELIAADPAALDAARDGLAEYFRADGSAK